MTGPHLTPKREAEIRALIVDFEAEGLDDELAFDAAEALTDALAALDAERRAHDQARTALEASTEDLVFAARKAREDKRPKFAAALDARVQANQVVLGLARPATEDA